jgi:hypothetical protein
MEKIDPQQDHLTLNQFAAGQRIFFRGRPYTIQRRTTLASGEAALVLRSDHEQFVISTARLIAGMKDD